MNSSQLLKPVSQPGNYLAPGPAVDTNSENAPLTPANVSALTGSRATNVLNATPSNFHNVTLDQIEDQTLSESERTYNALKALGVKKADLVLLTRFSDPKTSAIQLFNKKLSELHSVLSANNRPLEPSELPMLNAIQEKIHKLNTDQDLWSNLMTHLTNKDVST